MSWEGRDRRAESVERSIRIVFPGPFVLSLSKHRLFVWEEKDGPFGRLAKPAAQDRLRQAQGERIQ